MKPVATKTAKNINANTKPRSGAGVAKDAPAKVTTAKAASKTKPDPQVSHAPTPVPFRPPTRDEAAALQAFERARKEFTSGHFGEARDLFRKLIEKFSGVAEVKARARTYLTVTETRLRGDKAMPKDSEELYNRGVVELNRGDYVLAQELFERALRRDAASPATAAHAHYGLAAARARLGTSETALAALEKALTLQPSLRARAQYDADLASLRSTPEFENLVTTTRE
ncbi:MAG: tetratricopeptide repeat protein [Pyrinomonadaceae bacterium MAG19_C2-C3]|nr:tetratricopeptide repeat protein [Pyrinomonadaceae bacterium MAG19_C2-C3]